MVLARPDGEPVARAGTDTALPVARLLAGLRGANGHEDALDARHNVSLGTLKGGQETRLADRGIGCPRWDRGQIQPAATVSESQDRIAGAKPLEGDASVASLGPLACRPKTPDQTCRKRHREQRRKKRCS